MTDAWKQCEGQVIENNFPLQQYLGGTDYSAVFLTQLADPPAQKAAIKFIPASTSADLQLSVWRRTAQLTHPNLLRIFGAGRCRLANMDLLYAVMEYAEEDLSQILPQRPLSTSEAREMLEPVLDALVYLHDKGLVHAHIKPSNVLAAADRLKLSSDTLFPAGESRRPSRRSDAYDAPEVANSTLSVGADVWSLGVTLVEALTQQLPVLPLDNQANPIFPDTLPQPFLDIVRHALRRDPKRRCTIAEIAASLNPVAVAAAAAQSVSPLTAPPPPVPAVPAARLQIPKPVPPRPILPPLPPEIASPPRQTLVLPNYVVPLAKANPRSSQLRCASGCRNPRRRRNHRAPENSQPSPRIFFIHDIGIRAARFSAETSRKAGASRNAASKTLITEFLENRPGEEFGGTISAAVRSSRVGARRSSRPCLSARRDFSIGE